MLITNRSQLAVGNRDEPISLLYRLVHPTHRHSPTGWERAVTNATFFATVHK